MYTIHDAHNKVSVYHYICIDPSHPSIVVPGCDSSGVLVNQQACGEWRRWRAGQNLGSEAAWRDTTEGSTQGTQRDSDLHQNHQKWWRGVVIINNNNNNNNNNNSSSSGSSSKRALMISLLFFYLVCDFKYRRDLYYLGSCVSKEQIIK